MENLNNSDEYIIFNIVVDKFQTKCYSLGEYITVVVNKFDGRIITSKKRSNKIKIKMPKKQATIFALKFHDCIVDQRPAYIFRS